MQKPYFNLLDEPWIPCIYLDGSGQITQLGVQQVLAEAHRIREIYADSPLTVASLFRLLLAILHRVFGPKDIEAWKQLWWRGKWEMTKLEEKFSEWHSRFYLFHEQWPLYQVTRFPPAAGDVKILPVAALSLDLTSGNNTMLFDHSSDNDPQPISCAEAAQRLITYQSFSIGFGVSFGSKAAAVHFTDSPCVRGAFFFPEGENLFETLMLNLRLYPDPYSRLPDNESKDSLTWEQDPNLFFANTRKLPQGYLEFLTWQSRQVCLIPSEVDGKPCVSHVRRVQGREIDKEKVLDPLKSYRSDKSGKQLVRGFSTERVLWRDSTALFSLTQANYAPENFVLLSRLVDEGILMPEQLLHYHAIGLATSDGKAAAVVLWRSERMPLPLSYLRNQSAVILLGDAIQRAERAESALSKAAEWLAWLWVKDKDTSSKRGEKVVNKVLFQSWLKSQKYKGRYKENDFVAFRDRFPIERDYWWRLEQPFRQLMPGLADQDEVKVALATSDWCDQIRTAAHAAWSLTASTLELSPRSLKVCSMAEEILRTELEYAINPHKKGGSDDKGTDSNPD